MIVSEDDMSAVVQYRADTAAPAEARYNLTMAEIKADQVWSELYKAATGTIGDREATATAHADYWTARVAVAKAEREVEHHKAKSKWCDTVTTIWEREKFEAWQAERVR